MTNTVPTPEDHLTAIATIFAASVRRDPRRDAVAETITILETLATRIEAIAILPEIAATTVALKRCGRVLRGEMQ